MKGPAGCHGSHQKKAEFPLPKMDPIPYRWPDL